MTSPFAALLAACMLLISTTATAQQDVPAPATASSQASAGVDAAEGKSKRPTCAMPVYPKASLRNEETGTVVLEFLVGADGLVHDSRILKTTGFRELDVAAQTALSKCTFKPAKVDEVPTATWVKVSYVWSLR